MEEDGFCLVHFDPDVEDVAVIEVVVVSFDQDNVAGELFEGVFEFFVVLTDVAQDEYKIVVRNFFIPA